MTEKRMRQKMTPMKVKYEDIGYNMYKNENVYACICPDCGLEIIVFYDSDVDFDKLDKMESDGPEDMFHASLQHHGYMGLNNFCNRCGRRLDWN